MHTLYWRDLESPPPMANGRMQGLAVQVEGAHRAPSLYFICNPAARATSA